MIGTLYIMELLRVRCVVETGFIVEVVIIKLRCVSLTELTVFRQEAVL